MANKARAIGIQTAGLRELQARMKRLEVAVDPAALKEVLLEALLPIREEALDNLRAAGVKLGGKLKLNDQRHIEETLIAAKGKSSRVASAWCRVSDKFSPQGHWLEFGWVMWRGGRRRSGVGKQIRDIPARPWFRPAIDAQRAAIRRRIDEGILRLLWNSEK